MHYLLALIAGLMLPIQVAFNSRLTSFSGSLVVSSLVSFVVGTLALIVYSIANPGLLNKASLQIWGAPTYAWLGGLVGAFFILTSLIVTPKLGLTLALCLVIGGQLTMSVLMDHFGWFGFAVRPFTFVKGLGLLCVVAGVVLMKWK